MTAPVLIILIVVVIALLYSMFFYFRYVARTLTFFAGSDEEYNIFDRRKLLVFVFRLWGIFIALTFFSFGWFWFGTAYFWIMIIMSHRALLKIWRKHGYSPRLLIILNLAIIAVGFAVAPFFRAGVGWLLFR